MDELVSIIVPVYKTERYLNRCVNSILNQDYSGIEVILVDDGSPDKSGQLCDDISARDKRVLVIHKKNGGLSSARNAGIDVANGKYICFVDSDDYVEKDYVSTLINMIKRHDADLAKINYKEVTTDNYSEESVNVVEKVYSGDEVEKAFLELRVDSACVFMYKKNVIENIRFPLGKTSEDIPFNFEVFQKATRFVYSPQIKYYYWHNPESISNGAVDKNYFNYLLFREEIYSHYLKNGNTELALLAEVLYARAAMGIMARMALFGTTDNINEEFYKRMLKRVFREHSHAFYKDKRTAFNRKLVASLVFNAYPLAKLLRGIYR